jgi:catechol 2,3-dioxygenase-like lactoylglutathione lyase family enzyme
MPAKLQPRFTVITLGTADMRRAIAFYDALGFTRKMKQTGEAVAFYDTGASVLALWSWKELAADADISNAAQTPAFRGVTLAWNCNSREEVDAVIAHALTCGAELRLAAGATEYGGYRGYFADPDGHLWEAVTAPGIVVQADGRVAVPD